MATPAQFAANHSNARLSTGPRTPEGKAASAANATRHGFRSQSVLIPGDDPAEYNALLDELTDHYSPNRDLTEARFIREMADAEWRLRRARTHQERMLTDAINSLAAADPSLDAIALQIRAHEKLLADSPYFRQIVRFEQKFERQYNAAYRAWGAYQDDRRRARTSAAELQLKKMLFGTPPTALAPRTNEANPPAAPRTNEANRPAPETPRNAFCPCKSGLEFKRCCGSGAPGILTAA